MTPLLALSPSSAPISLSLFQFLCQRYYNESFAAYPRPRKLCPQFVTKLFWPLFATRPFRIYGRVDRANAPANDRSIGETRVRVHELNNEIVP